MKNGWGKYILFLLAALLCTAALKLLISERSHASVLKENTCEQMVFRRQYLTTELYCEISQKFVNGDDFADALTASMLNGNFQPKRISVERQAYLKYKSQEYELLKQCYKAIWSDVVCFPVPDRNISYEDTFGDARDYGGQRIHEGTDLFGEITESGYYPILSMTDGVVEQIGWLPLGGCRIGIRAPSGGYFYYAHLSEYAQDFQKGDAIDAGEILGFMGDTGYGPEGTRGQFPVHLHLGIYIKTPHYEEMSVDPYWVLKAAYAIEENRNGSVHSRGGS